MPSRSDTEIPNPSTATAPPLRIAVVASKTSSLTNFRFQLLAALRRSGHHVVALAPEREEDVIAKLKGIGVDFLSIPMKRTSINPVADLVTLWTLWRHFRRLKPDIVLPYTMKPIIYGGLAAMLAGVPRRFALITGMGYVFTTSQRSLRTRVLHHLSIWLYRLGLAGAERVFVYNPSDEQEVRDNKLLRDPSRIVVVPGSGVDLEHFAASEPPPNGLTFLLVARLLSDKGIHEYVEAARRVRQRFPKVRCQLLGPFDSNPASIPRSTVEGWVAGRRHRVSRRDLGRSTVSAPRLGFRAALIPRRNSAQHAGSHGHRKGHHHHRRARLQGNRRRRRKRMAGANPQFPQAQRSHGVLRGQSSAGGGDGAEFRRLACERFDVHAVNRLLLGQLGLDAHQLKK